ncbi:Maintenance of mitochondrial morphology protein 1 [Friedmanniomyces endolithicus]|uniref:Maintenance of mitochondrial morphology protein 1 n=1 Tax=Friedmanniomyces endolithicus TaxID=329885 RepID=A0A4U0UHY7_9PEZI|nr:ERMES complex subunit mmm1 [Friedmanniomyces endolithicus]TKA35208.1 Maintenance of mitochondrial morphology protein 1 [Friedmanniomyces endolithicus]
MSRAKQQAYAQQSSGSGSGSGFAVGFLLGQLTLALILFFFIKFFIFGEAPSADDRAATRAASRRQRTLSHNQAQARQRTLSSALRPRPSSALLKPRSEGGPTVQKLLEKTYYNVHGHQPESLDWFNVLIAQTVAQLRADAQEDEAVLTSLTAILNGPTKPDFLDEIRVTEISLGEEFPIFSNCRVIPVDEHGAPIKQLSGHRGERLQARMDVDLGDVVTLGIETKLVLNYPKPFVAVLPVALAVSVVRFSGTLSVSFLPSSQPGDPYPPPDDSAPQTPAQEVKNEGHPLNPTGSSPTTLTFTFLDDYRLDLSVHSLIGSRSRLQDVPKIAQLVESRIHQWFDDRCVEPRFQQIVLPSLWPRKRNTRGGDPGDDDAVHDDGTAPSLTERAPSEPHTHRAGTAALPTGSLPKSRKETTASQQHQTSAGAEATTTAEQRTRDWAARHGKARSEMSELEIAGAEMRELDERAKRKDIQLPRWGIGEKRDDGGDGGGGGLRLRPVMGGGRAASQRLAQVDAE